jgi:hypothetical protein
MGDAAEHVVGKVMDSGTEQQRPISSDWLIQRLRWSDVEMIQRGFACRLNYSPVDMWTYIDWIPTRPGPVKRFHTRLPALANNPVVNL